jgi:hypothetical protein
MYSTRILKYLCLLSGTLITLIGCYMKFTNSTSTGISSSKYSVGQPSTIDGNGTLVIGLLLLICSLIAHFTYNSEKKKREKTRLEDDKDVKIKKAKPINFYKNPTKFLS